MAGEGLLVGGSRSTFLLREFLALDLGSLGGMGAEVGIDRADPGLPNGDLPRATAELPVLPELLGLRLGIGAGARICQGADTRDMASTTVQPLERWRSGSGTAAW